MRGDRRLPLHRQPAKDLGGGPGVVAAENVLGAVESRVDAAVEDRYERWAPRLPVDHGARASVDPVDDAVARCTGHYAADGKASEGRKPGRRQEDR